MLLLGSTGADGLGAAAKHTKPFLVGTPNPSLFISRMAAEHPLGKAPTAWLETPHLTWLCLVPTAAELMDRAGGKVKIIIKKKKKQVALSISRSPPGHCCTASLPQAAFTALFITHPPAGLCLPTHPALSQAACRRATV